MQLSIHYYTLSLSGHISHLYEGFRDKLIDIQDTYFPFKISDITVNSSSDNTTFREFVRQTDQRFAHYFDQDPLRLIVIGERGILATFEAQTIHREIIISKVEGDYSMTSPHDLGMIVWPVVKDAIAGVNKNALRDLAKADKEKKIVTGIYNVGNAVENEHNPTLYVEDDYHVRGSISNTDQSILLSKHFNLWDVIDDVVDLIIEKVLKMGGIVIFLNNGSLTKHERIALIISN